MSIATDEGTIAPTNIIEEQQSNEPQPQGATDGSQIPEFEGCLIVLAPSTLHSCYEQSNWLFR